MSNRARGQRGENNWAKVAGGARTSRPGESSADVTVERLHHTIESKSRKALPAWLLRAFEQAQMNRERNPDWPAFVGIEYCPGRGLKRKYFLCLEIDPATADEYERTALFLTAVFPEATIDGSESAA